MGSFSLVMGRAAYCTHRLCVRVLNYKVVGSALILTITRLLTLWEVLATLLETGMAGLVIRSASLLIPSMSLPWLILMRTVVLISCLQIFTIWLPFSSITLPRLSAFQPPAISGILLLSSIPAQLSR